MAAICGNLSIGVRISSFRFQQASRPWLVNPIMVRLCDCLCDHCAKSISVTRGETDCRLVKCWIYWAAGGPKGLNLGFGIDSGSAYRGSNPCLPASFLFSVVLTTLTSIFHTLSSPRSKPATQHPRPSTTGRNLHKPCGSSSHRPATLPPAPVRGAPAARAARGRPSRDA
jgi:hypothetical protein